MKLSGFCQFVYRLHGRAELAPTILFVSLCVFSGRPMTVITNSAVSDVQSSFLMIVSEFTSGNGARVQRHAAHFAMLRYWFGVTPTVARNWRRKYLLSTYPHCSAISAILSGVTVRQYVAFAMRALMQSLCMLTPKHFL